MPLRRIQSGMVSRFANINFDTGTIFGNLSVSGSISASNISGISGTGGASGLIQAYYPYQTFNTTGVAGPNGTIFTLLSAVATTNDIMVFVSGVYQNKSLYYLSDNYTLVLTEIPPAGTGMLEVQYVKGSLYNLQTTIPADNSVIQSKIASNSVSNDKIQDGAVTYEKLSAIYAFIPVQQIQAGDNVTAYALLSAVADTNEIMVYIDGAYQNKNTYSIMPDNYTITFSEAPPSGAAIEISYLRSVPYTTFIPEVFSVNTSHIINGAVTTSKLADGAVTSQKTNFSDLYVGGGLTVMGNITAYGDLLYIDTSITVTSALSVVNFGTSPGLVVDQRRPDLQPSARFNGDVMIRGSLSASGGVIYSGGILDVVKPNNLTTGGSPGVLPAPSAGDMNKLFGSDGTWAPVEYFQNNKVRSYGQILGFAILSGGKNYTTPPRVTIDPPTSEAIMADDQGNILYTYRITASAEAILSGGQVVDFRLIHPGAGYTHYSDVSGRFGSTDPMGKAPPCRMTLTGGGGTGAIVYPLISNNGLPNTDLTNILGGSENGYVMFVTRNHEIWAHGRGSNSSGTGSPDGYRVCQNIPIQYDDCNYYPVIPVRLYTANQNAAFIDQKGGLWVQGYGGVGLLSQGQADRVTNTSNSTSFRKISGAWLGNSPIVKFKMMPSTATATSWAGALNAEGRFYMWGRGFASNSTLNNATPLGDGNAATDRTIPVDLYTVGGSPFGAIPQTILLQNPEALGYTNVVDFQPYGTVHNYYYYATIALRGDGTVWHSGSNYSGNMSDATGSTSTSYSTFTQSYAAAGVPLTNITWVSGLVDGIGDAGTTSYVLCANGRFLAAGANNGSQLLDGTQTNRSRYVPQQGLPLPFNVPGTHPNVFYARSQIYYNNYVTSLFTRLDDGRWFVGGRNSRGELGLGTTTEAANWTNLYPNISARIGARSVNATGVPTDITIKNIFHNRRNETGSTIFWLSNNRLYGCGFNGYGNLGLANEQLNTNITTVRPIPFNRRDIVDIRVGGGYDVNTGNLSTNIFLILTSDGNVWTAGRMTELQNGYWNGQTDATASFDRFHKILMPT
ncbi:hypothetical protein EBU95_01555 [bacterium]|nr:hypothetical protein [bacterium]